MKEAKEENMGEGLDS